MPKALLTCNYCGKSFHSRGFKRHETSCSKSAARREKDRRYEQAIKDRGKRFRSTLIFFLTHSGIIGPSPVAASSAPIPSGSRDANIPAIPIRDMDMDASNNGE